MPECIESGPEHLGGSLRDAQGQTVALADLRLPGRPAPQRLVVGIPRRVAAPRSIRRPRVDGDGARAARGGAVRAAAGLAVVVTEPWWGEHATDQEP